jgi:exodeoxyribonuclease-1
MVLPPSMLDDSTAQRLAINKPTCEQHWQTLRNLSLYERQSLQQKLYQLYSGQEFEEKTDPEQMLYSGFFDEQDKQLMVQVRQATPELLSREPFAFRDPRLKEMLFRYRARNFPTSLSHEERQRWLAFCRWRLTAKEAQASLTLDEFYKRMQLLVADENTTESQQDLLKQLAVYADKLKQSLFGPDV